MSPEFLAGMGSVLGSLIVALGGREGIKRWRRRNGHGNDIPVRLGVVERRMDTFESELREMRRDQLDQWKWQAQQAGSTARELELDKRIRELEKQDQFQRPKN